MDPTISTFFPSPSYTFITDDLPTVSGYSPLLKFDKVGIPGYVSTVAHILFKQYSNQNISKNKLAIDKRVWTTPWHDNTGNLVNSMPYSYLMFMQELRREGKVDADKFRLPLVYSDWLDRGIDITTNFHFTDGSGEAVSIKDGTLQDIYGEKFPVHPSIDRESICFSSINKRLTQRIVVLRKRLVENSDKCMMIDWSFELRNLINDSISLLDITLNQFYIKAEYNPEAHWNFKKEVVGERHNRRMKDKIKWVQMITGNPLNYEAERESFNRLKRVRNHLNHFDPPFFVLAFEEACELLNDVVVVANILVKLRIACITPISLELAELMSQKMVIFTPKHGSIKRTKLDKTKQGYNSSIWPKDIYHDSGA